MTDHDTAVIDLVSVRVGEQVHRFFKDERDRGPDAPNGKRVLHESGRTLTGRHGPAAVIPVGHREVEGPAVFHDGREWVVLLDGYRTGATRPSAQLT